MKNLDFKTIGKKIRYRRKSLEITQEQLANYLDVNPSHISNIEAGRAHPSLCSLISIANFLKCSVDTFIDSEYEYSIDAITNRPTNPSQIDAKLNMQLKLCDETTKEKISKIIDII